jgi:hypothetical protein
MSRKAAKSQEERLAEALALGQFDDLLTEEERNALSIYLAQMARSRRQAEAAAADWPMP